jgi:leucyl-tRNA synthetase
MEKDKLFITVMFPYPSGAGLHVGHWYNYAIVDSYCKIQKFLGKQVFQPIGFDSFGLPAENYAKKIGGDPKIITYQNIDNFRTEMARMNTSFQERLITSDPNYQEKTQALFIKLLNNGLAYKALRNQNYCPSCETVLSNEQVVNNCCDRCETTIQIKELNQWFSR